MITESYKIVPEHFVPEKVRRLNRFYEPRIANDATMNAVLSGVVDLPSESFPVWTYPRPFRLPTALKYAACVGTRGTAQEVQVQCYLLVHR
jgi:hypothetical protein